MASAAVAAKHIFISPTRFRDLVAVGKIKKKPSGNYVLDEVREQYITNMQRTLQGRGEDGGKSLSAQRAKLTAAQAKAAERKNEIASGAYVTTVAVQNELGKMFGVMREIALGTPGKISDSLQAFTPLDREKIFEIVKAQIYEMLENLSDPEVVAALIVEKEKAK
jgi:phage terminase Nu1 subunit (DNA packaging protein)